MRSLKGFLTRRAADPTEAVPSESGGGDLFGEIAAPVVSKSPKHTGRVFIYAVRVRETFKAEILALQAELQVARLSLKGKPRKVTEGEVMEYMLDTTKVMRRNQDRPQNDVVLPDDVWLGVYAIARHLQCSPADAVEQLVAEKAGELGLVPRR